MKMSERSGRSCGPGGEIVTDENDLPSKRKQAKKKCRYRLTPWHHCPPLVSQHNLQLNTPLIITAEAKAYQLNHRNARNFLCIYALIIHISAQPAVRKSFEWKFHPLCLMLSPPPIPPLSTPTAAARVTAPPSIINTSSHSFMNPLFQTAELCREEKPSRELGPPEAHFVFFFSKERGKSAAISIFYFPSLIWGFRSRR